MPRANRHFLPGHVWHITHRCHQRKFLLKFARDRRRYLWGFRSKEAVKSLCARLHGHIQPCPPFSEGTDTDVIAQSMQPIAGRTAQEYNQRKSRQGAFWEDRYHATAIDADQHLHRCLVYIDLNMVRAGAVNHPEKWKESGFREIQKPPKRYAIINLQSLSELCGFADPRTFKGHIASRLSRGWRTDAR